MQVLRTAVRAAFVCLVAITFLWGCSGPQPTPPPVDEPDPTPEQEPAPPSFDVLVGEDAGIVYRTVPGTEKRVLLPSARPLDFSLASPSGDRLAFAYALGDSAYLALFDAADAAIRPVHAAPLPVTYTGAWDPAGTALAFAFDGDAATGVRIYEGGAVTDVGCSASTLVAAWPRPDRLVTGDGDNLYVVARDGCGTISTKDARKMHHVAFSPDGRLMAYIYRDLRYDRGRGEYVPDSSLHVARYDGSNDDELFDDAYRPRHLTWSPDGALGFDIRSQDDPSRRRVVLYDTTSGGFSYLVAPGDFPDASDVRPGFSPSGRNIDFELRGHAGTRTAVRAFARTHVVATGADSTWGWVDDETIVVASDSLRALSIAAETAFTLPASNVLLFARRASSSASR